MARKKKQAATRKRKQPIRSPADSAAARTNVLLEDMQSQLRVVAEGTVMTREVLLQKIDELRTEMKDNFDVVHIVLRGHTDDIATLKTGVSKLETKMSAVENKIDKTLSLEGRVTALEAKAG